MQHQKIDQLLLQLGLLDNIQGLKLNHNGAAKLQFSSGKTVYFEYNQETDRLFIYTPLFYLPTDPSRKNDVLTGLLSANFLKLKSGEGEFAIQQKENTVIYQIALNPNELTVKQLDNHVENLLSQDLQAKDFIHRPLQPSATAHSYSFLQRLSFKA
jgi:hypothetical protein